MKIYAALVIFLIAIYLRMQSWGHVLLWAVLLIWAKILYTAFCHFHPDNSNKASFYMDLREGREKIGVRMALPVTALLFRRISKGNTEKPCTFQKNGARFILNPGFVFVNHTKTSAYVRNPFYIARKLSKPSRVKIVTQARDEQHALELLVEIYMEEISEIGHHNEIFFILPKSTQKPRNEESPNPETSVTKDELHPTIPIESIKI